MEQEAGRRQGPPATAARVRCGLRLRVPPHSVEAEQAVLGGLLLDNSTWDTVADRLRAEDFYRRDHQLIFEAIAELSARSEPERRRHARRVSRGQGPGGRDRRPRLPRGPRARHAHRRQHPRLCGHRPRALAAAAADPRQRRDRGQRVRQRRPPGRGTRRRRRTPRVPDRRSRAAARARASCRCATCSARRSTGSTCCTSRRGSSPASAPATTNSTG